ncbi:MAG: hypothetical protein MUE41_13790, partial [Gemmatimonadaceae bacterium]|nr:hypothetical protein [Gemmatimonadaceae bacterium]
MTALLLLALVALSGVAAGVLTQSARGQQFLAQLAVAQLARGMQGRMHVGRVSGTLFTDLVIDTIALRDWQDSLVLTSGRIALRWDPRDLLDRRIRIRSLEAEHPKLWIRQYENGDWNYRHVFGEWGKKGPPRIPGQRRFGDVVLVDTATVRDGDFALSLPWHVADSLRGVKRDSALAYALGRLDADIVPAGGDTKGRWYMRTWRWTRISYALGATRLADPDSAGQRFTLRDFSAVETDPAFAWRNVRGIVRKLHDSVWVDIAHWDLASSTGTGKGKIWWGSNLPTRYDITVRGDSVSMRDVAWVYPTLPRSGGGTVTLNIVSQPRNPRVIEYQLRDMDARSMDSRLRGDLTFAVGGPVLGVTDVDLSLEPMDMALARTFNGEPFPYDWQGTITGRVVGPGGPANRFVVERAELEFADRHVPGARSRATGRGMVDILFPAFARFRGFQVTDAEVDLRTPRFVNPDFPELNGVARGQAILDSLWYDVRFREADVEHVDGEGPPSRVTGSGRFTIEEEFVRFDLTLEAPQLSYTTLARSYPALPLRGVASGPIRATGTANDATVAIAFTGPGGVLRYDGQVDAFEPAFGARGTWSADSVSLPLLFGDSTLPPSRLALRGAVAATGAGPGDLDGTFGIDILDGSRVRDVRVYEGRVRAAVRAGRLKVDTARITTSAGRLEGSGGLGLTGSVRDTLRVSATVDSLGGWRRVLGDRELGGALTLRALVAGTLDSLVAADDDGVSVQGLLNGTDVQLDAARARRAQVEFDVRDLMRVPRGQVVLQVDSADVVPITASFDDAPQRGPKRLAYARAVAAIDSGRIDRGSVLVRGANGAFAALGGRRVAANAVDGIRSPDASVALYQLDSLTIVADTAQPPYRLTAPVPITNDANGWSMLRRLDVARPTGAGVAVRAAQLRVGAVDRPSGALTGEVEIRRVPLADLGRLAQLATPLAGTVTAGAELTDVNERSGRGTLRLDSARIGPLRVDTLVGALRYGQRRLLGRPWPRRAALRLQRSSALRRLVFHSRWPDGRDPDRRRAHRHHRRPATARRHARDPPRLPAWHSARWHRPAIGHGARTHAVRAKPQCRLVEHRRAAHLRLARRPHLRPAPGRQRVHGDRPRAHRVARALDASPGDVARTARCLDAAWHRAPRSRTGLGAG